MSLWLKITLIVFGAVLVSAGISLIPATNLALSSSPPPPSSIQRMRKDELLFHTLFVRPPPAVVDACLGSPKQLTLTHGDVVRLAKCLHRKHRVSARTVAAAEKSHEPGVEHRLVTLETGTTTETWWWWLTWAVALMAIAVVVYRHRRRRPPPSKTAAQTG